MGSHRRTITYKVFKGEQCVPHPRPPRFSLSTPPSPPPAPPRRTPCHFCFMFVFSNTSSLQQVENPSFSVVFSFTFSYFGLKKPRSYHCIMCECPNSLLAFFPLISKEAIVMFVLLSFHYSNTSTPHNLFVAVENCYKDTRFFFMFLQTCASICRLIPN